MDVLVIAKGKVSKFKVLSFVQRSIFWTLISFFLGSAGLDIFTSSENDAVETGVGKRSRRNGNR